MKRKPEKREMNTMLAKLKLPCRAAGQLCRGLRARTLLSLLCALAALAGTAAALLPVQPTRADPDIIQVHPVTQLDIDEIDFEEKMFQSYYDPSYHDIPFNTGPSGGESGVGQWPKNMDMPQGTSGYISRDGEASPDHVRFYPRTETEPPSVLFAGYEDVPAFDAIYTEQYDVAQIDFDFEPTRWDNHTFDRTGIFLNSKMNPDGTITGYLITFQESYGSYSPSYTLYYVEDLDIDLYTAGWKEAYWNFYEQNFAIGYEFGNGGGGSVVYFPPHMENCSASENQGPYGLPPSTQTVLLVNSGSVCPIGNGSPKMHLSLELTDTSIKLSCTPNSANPSSVKQSVISYTLPGGQQFPGWGFGLFTLYMDHGCTALTYMEYSDFVMTPKKIPAQAQANFKIAGTETELRAPYLTSGAYQCDYYTINPPATLEAGGKTYHYFNASRSVLKKIPFQAGNANNITDLYYIEAPSVSKDAYINNRVFAENRNGDKPFRVNENDTIRYDITINNTSGTLQVDPVAYDVLFVVDWSGSMRAMAQYGDIGYMDDAGTSVAIDNAANLICDTCDLIFESYPGSRFALLGMNSNPVNDFANYNDPALAHVQFETDFGTDTSAVTGIFAANAGSAFSGDDVAVYLEAGTAKMNGETPSYGGGSGTPISQIGYPRADQSRIPVIVLISDFQIDIGPGGWNNSGTDYWANCLGARADAFSDTFDDGILMTVRMDTRRNMTEPPYFGSATYDALMADHVVPYKDGTGTVHGSADRYDAGWRFFKAAYNAPYADIASDFINTFEESAPPVVYPAIITDTVPDGLEITGTTPAAVVDGQAVTWFLEELPAGESVVTIETAVREPGEYLNTAAVKILGLEPLTTNETWHRYKLYTPPCLLLEKTNDTADNKCDIGDTIIYTVHVENCGECDAGGVAITDQLPPGMDYVAGSAEIDGVAAAGASYDAASRTLVIPLGNVKGDDSESEDCENGYDVTFAVAVNGDEIAEDLRYANQALATYNDRYEEEEEDSVSYSNIDEIDLEMRHPGGQITDEIPEGLEIGSTTDAGGTYSWTAGTRTAMWAWTPMPTGKTTVSAIVDVTEAQPLYRNQAFFTIEDEPPVPTNETWHGVLMELKLHIRQVVIGPISELPRPAMGYYSLLNDGAALPLTSDSVSPGYPFTDYRLLPGDDKIYKLTDFVPQYYEFLGHIQNPGDDHADHRPENPAAAIDFTANGDIELDYTDTDEIWITGYITPKGMPGNHQTGVETNRFGEVYPKKEEPKEPVLI